METRISANYTPAFGRIRIGSGAEEVLKKRLKDIDWPRLGDMVDEQIKNPADVILFATKNGKSLVGRVVPPIECFNTPKLKDYKKRMFEPVINFISRLCTMADEANKRHKSFKDLNPEQILNKIKLD